MPKEEIGKTRENKHEKRERENRGKRIGKRYFKGSNKCFTLDSLYCIGESILGTREVGRGGDADREQTPKERKKKTEGKETKMKKTQRK